MCELLAMCANRNVDVHLAWRGLQAGALQHSDGWGAAWWSGGRFEQIRRPEALPIGERGRGPIEPVRTEQFVGHLRRKVSQGDGEEDTQPFVSADGMYAFAGTMSKGFDVSKRFGKQLREVLEGTTGPEIFFRLALQKIELLGEVQAALGETIIQVFCGDSARSRGRASFVFADGATMWAYGHGRSVWRLSRTPPHEGTITLRSSSGAGYTANLESVKEPTETAVLIASEPLTDEAWEKLADRRLLSFVAADL